MAIVESTIFAAMNMVSAGILGLAFILLVVFCVMSAKTWHWVNIVFVILTFMAGVAACFGVAKVYDLRTKAIAEADKWEQAAEKAQREADEQVNGNPTSLTYDPGSLRYIDGVLTREMAGRGRVWPRGQISADGNNRVFTFAAARSAGFDPLQDVVLFAFLEQTAGFIGSVRVVEEAAGTVKLEPVALADFQQYVTPTGTWALFEKMPLDRRGTFKKATIAIAENENAPDVLKEFAATLADENAELDITKFRQVLEARFLQPQRIGLDPNSIEYEALIDRYAFDGLSLGTIQNWIDQNSADRKSPRFEPSPEEIFIKYEFNKPSRDEGYQVDGNGSVENDGLFNQQGHAIDDGLKNGGPVHFVKGDTVLVDQRSADGYQRNGTPIDPFKNGEDVKEVDRIYIRQVRDFPYEFGNLTFQSAVTDDEIQRVSQSNVVQQKLIDDTTIQLEERARLINDNSADKTNLENDLDTATALVAQKEQEVAAMTQMVSTLESKINAAYTELRNLSIALSRKAFAGR